MKMLHTRQKQSGANGKSILLPLACSGHLKVYLTDLNGVIPSFLSDKHVYVRLSDYQTFCPYGRIQSILPYT